MQVRNLLIHDVKVSELPLGHPDFDQYFQLQCKSASTDHPYVRIYRNAHGESVRVGMTKEVREVLEMPFGAINDLICQIDELSDERTKRIASWDMMSRAYTSLKSEAEAQACEMIEMQCASLWIRIKWLFTGVK